MLHEQNLKELKKLCGGEIPPDIMDFFQEATDNYEKLRGRQFRTSEMAILYTCALRAKASKPAKSKDAKPEPKKPEAKKPEEKAPEQPVLEIDQPVLVDDDGTTYKGKFAGNVDGDPSKVWVSYRDGESKEAYPRERVKATE